MRAVVRAWGLTAKEQCKQTKSLTSIAVPSLEASSVHRQDDSDDDAMVITHGQPPRRGGTREEGPNNTSEVQSKVENGGTGYQEALKKEVEKLRAEFHRQQERTKHQMTVKEEVAVMKQAVAKEIFPSYKFVTHEGTLQPMGAIASHVRKRLGYDSIKRRRGGIGGSLSVVRRF